MVNSMTGYGRVEKQIDEKTFVIEIRSLNGKQFDLQLKIPSLLKPFEFEIRNLLQENLLRGTVDCFVTIKQNGTSKPSVLNIELLQSYYNQVKATAEQVGASPDAVLGNLLRLPEIYSPSTDVLSDEEFASFKKIMLDAIHQLIDHRKIEGESIHNDLALRIENIQKAETQIVGLESGRVERIRQEINSLLEENVGKENIDNNRFEQELIYYLEKIDIHEEQVRLKQHCEFFLEVLNGKNASVGKKLSFILQEIGREINTTGSKAYDADIQKIVVQMKDELEKAKEQILNVL